MFLSKLLLDPKARQVRIDLRNPYDLHRTLMNGYPYPRPADGDANELLFRLDPCRTNEPTVLVQCKRTPDWSRLPAGYHSDGIKDISDLTFNKEQRLRFRLRANPTKRVAAKNERLGPTLAGKRVALFTETEQVAWLIDKGKQGGFAVPGGWVQAKDATTVANFRVQIIPEGWIVCGKGGHSGGRFLSVRFEGLLEVTDPALFRQTLAAGIGPAKAFGFGLLSVAPVSPDG